MSKKGTDGKNFQIFLIIDVSRWKWTKNEPKVDRNWTKNVPLTIEVEKCRSVPIPVIEIIMKSSIWMLFTILIFVEAHKIDRFRDVLTVIYLNIGHLS